MDGLTFDVKMDINKIIEEKVEKPFKKIFFDIIDTTYNYITISSAESTGSYGSPVLTGRYHASHTIALNNINTSIRPEGLYPLRLSLGNTNPIKTRFKFGDKVYIANSLDYAGDIEYNKASPFKTPEGVYRVSVAAVKARFKYRSR